jgi:uncharacterized caspase-like protein
MQRSIKERYYEPGLLAKILNDQPLREVSKFDNVKLYPQISIDDPALGINTLGITLTNRGGGIGKVIADARGDNANPNAAQVTKRIDLQQFSRYYLPGQPNEIEVFAYNDEGWLRSRSSKLVYTPPNEKALDPPRLWAVFLGVSDYRDGGTLRDLTFAAKDAEAMATAFRVASERLFPGRTDVRVLTTSTDKPEQKPTRQNIEATLKDLATKAKPNDILVLYLAGHGVSWGGQDGDFYFLTMDASTGDLKDSSVRQATALSSEELANLVIKIPTSKQVMILDTCASGRLIEKLTETRNVESSVIRAWDRMKDRAGLWILAGSAADAVSYESSRYGQGVLTYSLLQGLKRDWDKVLRRDEGSAQPELIDVSALFNYSADAVPQLAQGIGGIQKPLIAARRDARSFDVGQLKSEDRARIPLALEKPVYLRSDFQLASRPRDALELTKRIDALLRENSSRGIDARLVFWGDITEHPDAYRIAGRYDITGTKVTVKVYLYTFVQRGASIEEQEVGQSLTVEGDSTQPEQLAARILYVKHTKMSDTNYPGCGKG